ncbi:hypothetical protein J437_LFUL013235 [Ladona fulva]|uniref:PPM-type phosphatase domain-containing protein n=1 Tax=Ladona fulva TaxID=123851 RepID=A0A8K0K3L1_LADFU|nr:hypothetical protein J437_LFUL013235 [Ladona fulva]
MPSALPRRLRCLLLGKNRIRSVGTEGPSGKLRESKDGSNKAKKPREINGEGVEDGEEEVDGEGAKKTPRRRCWEETKNPGDQEVTQLSPSLLEKIDLRANLLDGDVVLGNYENLKELDLSDNEIERLDVRSLRHLSVVQCARNSLVHLSLPGHKLTTLVASQNSKNELEVLPDWPWERFRQLNFLDASHNHLQNLPHRLHVAPNLTELHLHANRINTLHEGFLSSPSLQVINLSNNLLSGGLPTLVLGSNGLLPWSSPLLSLRLTGNNLTDAIWEALSELTALQVLHLAYNSLTTMPEKCVEMWTDMEELIVSGNMLCILPDSIGQLQKLRVLRAHSNKLCKPPKELSKLNNLRVLDLSHNQLERVNLGDLVPQRLSFLDLSGNSRLHVDPSQFNSYRSQRRMSLVDVSGNNRTSLPSAPYHEAGESYQTVDESIEGTDQHIGPPWKIGFSETPGNHNRLYTTQIRLPAFCNTEGLFGLFDGGSVRQVNEAAAETASLLASVVPRILLEERTVKETATDYMKYTLLSAHRELKEKGQRFGACAILCHITAEGNSCKAGLNNIIANEEDNHPQYVLRIASVGRVGAVLCRKDGTLLPLTAPIKSLEENGLNSETEEEENKLQSKIDPQDQHALGLSASFPQVVPDPYVTEVALSPKRDHCIIIANKIFWASVQQDEASHEAGMMLRNSAEACGTEEMLTAKRLQDLAQGYGNTGNLSIIVVHLFGCNDKQNGIRRDGMRKSLSLIQRNGTTDMLMKELKEELRSHHPCHRHCCCHCSWTTEEDKEECHLCLPHVCHRRWCAGMPEERGGCSVENGLKPVAVTNGITHYKIQTLSKSKLSDSKIVQKDEVCTRNKSTVSECHTKTINVASEVCVDEHEVHGKNLPERSSPSGQSDDTPTGSTKDKNDLEDKTSQGNSDSGLSQCTIKENYWDENGKNGEVSKLRRIPGAWDVCVGSESVLMREKGLHKVSAMPALVMADDYNILGNREKGHSEEESSQVGGVDERFKCWEYMLEQNTQLLFDKELDTISRGIVRGRTRAPWTDGHTANSSGPVHANNSGPPQYRPPPSPAPFHSRRFSSARGVGKGGRGWGKCSHNGIKWGGSGRGHPPVEIHSPPIQGGPNAAYFGSLQRLLPGHVGFDFEAVQERHRSHNGSRHDDISEGERSWEKDNESSTGETESRMQSYWGVATTEL